MMMSPAVLQFGMGVGSGLGLDAPCCAPIPAAGTSHVQVVPWPVAAAAAPGTVAEQHSAARAGNSSSKTGSSSSRSGIGY